MRYFSDRTLAGQLLAKEVGDKYARQSCAVVALSSGGLVVGAEVAKSLHASLYLLPTSSVLDREHAGAMSQMTSTAAFSAALSTERYNLEEVTRNSDFMLSRLQLDNFLDGPILTNEGIMNKTLIAHHNIIVVSDGIANGLSIALADSFFRPITTKNIIVATPLCNVDLIERVHDMTREFFYLESIQSEYPIGHYYDAKDIPSAEEAFELMRNISLSW